MKSPKKNYRRKLYGKKGFDYVCCRICGDRRQVINGRHLAKHDIDRETYLAEFGLSPDELIAKVFRVNQSYRKEYRPLGKGEWIAAIRKHHKETGNIVSAHLQKTNPYLYVQGRWIFGDWKSALRAIRVRPKRVPLGDEQITAKIKWMRRNHMPLNAAYVMKHHRREFAAVLWRYGSWAKALCLAGIADARKVEMLYASPSHLLRALSDALYTHSKHQLPATLKMQLEFYFGSVEKALAKLRKHEESGWSKRKITVMIRRMRREKQDLGYMATRRSNPVLLSAADRHFGSWGNALYAAGIDPNQYFVYPPWRSREGQPGY